MNQVSRITYNSFLIPVTVFFGLFTVKDKVDPIRTNYYFGHKKV